MHGGFQTNCQLWMPDTVISRIILILDLMINSISVLHLNALSGTCHIRDGGVLPGCLAVPSIDEYQRNMCYFQVLFFP